MHDAKKMIEILSDQLPPSSLPQAPSPKPPRAINGKVACAPFVSMSVEKEIRGGMACPKQRGTMTKLEVVLDSGKGAGNWYSKGSSVWVRAEQFQLQWAKDVFDLDGTKFILVPEEQILLVQY
jgi:hypothetical protein